MLVGDSTMRMLFHLLVGCVMLSWPTWPAAYDHRGPPWSNGVACDPVGNRSATNKCLLDVFHRGVRITLVWLDFAAPAQLEPLFSLMQRTVLYAPSAVVVGVGEWHRMFRYDKLTELETHLEGVLLKIDGALSRLTSPSSTAQRTRRLMLGLNSCNSAMLYSRRNATHDDAERVLQRVAARHSRYWKYLDRGPLTKAVCNASDCKFGEAHPVGDTLNVILKLVLLNLGYWQTSIHSRSRSRSDDGRPTLDLPPADDGSTQELQAGQSSYRKKKASNSSIYAQVRAR